MQCVAGELRSDQVRQRQRHALGGREAVFAVKNHAVGAIEQQYRRARTLVLALTDLEVAVIEFERQGEAVAANGGEQRRVDVQVQRVAELVRAGGAVRFDAGRLLARIVAAETGFSERGKQILEGLEAQEIERLVSELELDLALPGLVGLRGPALRQFFSTLRRLVYRDIAFLREPLEQLVDQFSERRVLVVFGAAQQLIEQLFGNQALLAKGLEEFLMEFLHGLGPVHFVEAVSVLVEAALEEIVSEELEKVFGAETVKRIRDVFGVLDVFHRTSGGSDLGSGGLPREERHEMPRDELLEGRGRGIGGGAGFERPHVSGIQCLRHFEQRVGHAGGHPHRRQGRL